MKHYTTIEQSKKLLELGLNPETADMYYFLDPTPAGNIYSLSLITIEKHLKSRMPEYDKGDIPCWSLEALITIMPDKINQFILVMTKCMGDIIFAYINEHDQYIAFQDGNGSIEAAFNMVVWLLENNYIEK